MQTRSRVLSALCQARRVIARVPSKLLLNAKPFVDERDPAGIAKPKKKGAPVEFMAELF